MRLALTRDVSPSIDQCQLTHLARDPIDLERARAQHRAYEACLESLGCSLRRLPADPLLPDSVFVEDCAVVLDEVAVLTRPGAPSRRPEVMAIEQALIGYRPIARIAAPDTLDGGDVLRVGRQLFVGLSARTTPGGVEQLARLLAPFDYRVGPAEVRGCLHLKSAATEVAPGVLLLNRGWTGSWAEAFECIEVDPEEPFAANGLLIGERLVYPSAFPRTLGRLERHGIATLAVDVSELAKAEGGVTCCSLIFQG
ncbi:MAG TPA: arginine deiminase family protein [Vicinamibacterales bacterium]|nr:arginine deiminase family protein [Vicinamibacterales bacterium]